MTNQALDPSDEIHSLLRRLVDHQSAMLAYWDTSERCHFANRAYREWFGVEPETLLGKTMHELLGPLYQLNLPHIQGALRGEPQEFEREIPNPFGGPPRHSLAQYIPDVVAGRVRGFFVLVTDVTRLKHAETELLQMERKLQARAHLVALGTLAAGIGHEINNPLTWVIGNIELALEELNTGAFDLDTIKGELEEARAGSQRLRNLVQSMKVLARGERAENDLVDLRDILDKSIVFASAQTHEASRIESSCPGSLWVVAK